MSGQIHADFLRLVWVLADKQLWWYHESMGKEDKIGNEAFRWASFIGRRLSSFIELIRRKLDFIPFWYTHTQMYSTHTHTHADKHTQIHTRT